MSPTFYLCMPRRHRRLQHYFSFNAIQIIVFLSDFIISHNLHSYTRLIFILSYRKYSCRHFHVLPRDAMLARYLLSSCVRLSVCSSQAGVVSKRLDESSWLSAWRLSSICPTLCSKKISVSPKIRVLPSGTLSQTHDLGNFATASRSCCQQNSSSSSSTVELVDDTYTTIDESWLFTTKSVNCNPPTPLLRFLVDLYI